MRLADDGEVRRALDNLEAVIDARIRYAQRRDDLTNLWNGRALEEMIDARIVEAKPFWVAFVEVDKFKAINDQYGYQNADVLLTGVGATLREMAACFPSSAEAFRAHGDEFYLLGTIPSESAHVLDTIQAVLDRVRATVAELRVKLEQRAMQCTVSVGWVLSVDVEPPVTSRATLVCLERAVQAAKIAGRNRVVRYDRADNSEPSDSERGDCSACHCKFSFDVKRSKNRTKDSFHCPNCGVAVERPSRSEAAPERPADGSHTGVVRLEEDGPELELEPAAAGDGSASTT